MIKRGTVWMLPSGRYEFLEDIHIGDVIYSDLLTINGKRPKNGDLMAHDFAEIAFADIALEPSEINGGPLDV